MNAQCSCWADWGEATNSSAAGYHHKSAERKYGASKLHTKRKHDPHACLARPAAATVVIPPQTPRDYTTRKLNTRFYQAVQRPSISAVLIRRQRRRQHNLKDSSWHTACNLPGDDTNSHQSTMGGDVMTSQARCPNSAALPSSGNSEFREFGLVDKSQTLPVRAWEGGEATRTLAPRSAALPSSGNG